VSSRIVETLLVLVIVSSCSCHLAFMSAAGRILVTGRSRGSFPRVKTLGKFAVVRPRNTPYDRILDAPGLVKIPRPQRADGSPVKLVGAADSETWRNHISGGGNRAADHERRPETQPNGL
jgi:hypothetical protein